jgi:hypothetical protein
MNANLLKFNLGKPLENRISRGQIESSRLVASIRGQMAALQATIHAELAPKLAALRVIDSRWERTLGRPLGTAKVEPIGHAVHLGTMPDLATENEPRFAAIVECAAIAQDK